MLLADSFPTTSFSAKYKTGWVSALCEPFKKNMRKLPLRILLAIGTLLSSVGPVAAITYGEVVEKYLPVFSTEGACAAPSVGDAPDITGLLCVLVRIISILLTSAGVVALLFLMIGGLRYMASGGDEKAITAAKSAITYAVLGLIIILGAIFGVNLILTVILAP